MDSKIAKKDVAVAVADSEGNTTQVVQKQPEKVLAIRFKKIIRTSTITENGKMVEKYQFVKKRDADGNPTECDAEFYSFTGSKIMIDQAENDFSVEDLPCPTIIRQFEMSGGKTYTKFT